MSDARYVHASSTGWARPARLLWPLGPGTIAVLLLAIVLLLQLLSGAFQSERGLYSDEAAHLLNGVLLRDYLREGLGQSPVEFARDFYTHYPKVAPFMWPPLFHGLLGLALLPGWSPTGTALVLLGVGLAWMAFRLQAMVRAFASPPLAVGAVALLLTTPGVVGLATSVMLDLVVAVFAFEAAYWLGRLAHSGRTRDAALFGLMTALACASKGNGVSAVLAPLVLLAVTGRWVLLRRPGFYVAAAITVAIAVPPLYIAYRLDSPLGDFGPLSLGLMWSRWLYYSHYVVQQLGPAVVGLAVVGAVVALVRRYWTDDAPRSLALGLVAMIGGGFAFHLANPHILPGERYITLVFAPVIGLAALGVAALARLMHGRVSVLVQLTLVLAVAVLHAGSSPDLTAQRPLGFRAMFTTLDRAGQLAGRRLLLVSNENGEGAGVAVAAVLGRQPSPTIVRGSKLLATDDWMGRSFQMRYDSAEALLAALEAMHMDYVLLDRSPDARALGYWSQVHTLVSTRHDRFEQVLSVPANPVHGPLRPLTLYRLKHHAPGPPASVAPAINSPLLPAP